MVSQPHSFGTEESLQVQTRTLRQCVQQEHGTKVPMKTKNTENIPLLHNKKKKKTQIHFSSSLLKVSTQRRHAG